MRLQVSHVATGYKQIAAMTSMIIAVLQGPR